MTALWLPRRGKKTIEKANSTTIMIYIMTASICGSTRSTPYYRDCWAYKVYRSTSSTKSTRFSTVFKVFKVYTLLQRLLGLQGLQVYKIYTVYKVYTFTTETADNCQVYWLYSKSLGLLMFFTSRLRCPRFYLD